MCQAGAIQLKPRREFVCPAPWLWDAAATLLPRKRGARHNVPAGEAIGGDMNDGGRSLGGGHGSGVTIWHAPSTNGPFELRLPAAGEEDQGRQRLHRRGSERG